MRRPLSSPAAPARSKVELLDEQLHRMGFDRAIGVPDSQLNAILGKLGERLPVTITPREDVAVAAACGLSLAGGRPLLYMKNAGLFAAGDALVSLAIDLKVPLTLLVGWAGSGSDTLPHHVVSGQRTAGLLNSLGIAWRTAATVTGAGAGPDDSAAWIEQCRRDGMHTAILVSPGDGHGQ